jgi:Mg-chelatase subunit ChlD
MSIASPLAFLLLLFIPLILVFHMLHMRRPEVRVTTLRFWERNDREDAAAASIRRLRPNLLMFLQILAVLLIILALARPTVTRVMTGYPRAVLVIDTSASMKATDVRGGRFAAAQASAAAFVASMPAGQQGMLFEASSRPRALVPFTRDRQALRRAIEALQPGDGSGRMDEAVSFASEVARRGPPFEVHLFTDAAFVPLGPRDDGSPPIRWHVVGRGSDNVGITALQTRKSLYGTFDYEAFAALSNFAAIAKSFTLRLTLDGVPLNEQPVVLPARTKRSFAIPFTHAGGGVLRAEIDLRDDLEADNHAHVVMPAPRPIRVLLVTRGNLFLEEALRSDRQIALQRAQPSAAPLESWRGDVIVLDNYAPAELPPGNYLLVHSLARAAPLMRLGRVSRPQVIDWDRQHPAMRSLDLSGLVVQGAMKVRPMGGGRALVDSEMTPLIYAWEEGGVKAIFLGFDLRSSDLPVRAAFPLFVSNAIRWLHPNRLDEAQPQLFPGQPIEVEADVGADQPVVIDPSGRARRPGVGVGRLVYADTLQAGIYAVRTGSAERKFAVNLLDEQESDLTPGRGAPRGPSTGAVGATHRSAQEWWAPLAVTAWLILLVEAILYYRRTRGSAPTLAVGLRAAVLSLIALAVFRIQIQLPSDRLRAVFLIDTSDSIPLDQKLTALDRARESLRFRGPLDSAGLIAFGATPRVEVNPEAGNGLPEKLSSPPDGKATDIGKAIRLGMALLPQGGAGRLVLLTDGNETRGSASDAAREARASGVEIYPIPLGGADPGDVSMERMVLPQEVRRGEPFVLRVVAWAGRESEGRLFLYRNGTFVGSRSVRLRGGKNVFSYQESVETEGFHVYQARLEVPGDVAWENNRAVGVVAARGRPRVLYIERDREQGATMADALQAQGIQVEQVALDGIAAALERLADFDAVILSNVSALRLTKAQMEAVRSHVRDRGGGLLMLGGEESFGVGGYYRTPIEEALPVVMGRARSSMSPPWRSPWWSIGPGAWRPP